MKWNEDMEIVSTFKKTLIDLIYIFNIFDKDSISRGTSIQKSLLDAIICFGFFFLITFNYNDESQFKISQLVINVFYPQYDKVEFCKIFNYFPILFCSILINTSLSFVTTIVFTIYLFFDIGFDRIKSVNLLTKIFCQSSKCLSLCGLVMFFILPISYIKILSNSLLIDLHLSANISQTFIKPISWIYFISAIILLFGLVRPLAQLRHIQVVSKVKLLSHIDTNFHASLMFLLLLMGYLYMQVPKIFISAATNTTSALVNKSMLVNNYCKYLISSPYTPPAIKFGYKQVGCNRYVSCIEMPDDTTRNVCLNQLLLSSSDFMNISKYGENNYCKLPYVKPSFYPAASAG